MVEILSNAKVIGDNYQKVKPQIKPIYVISTL